VPEKQEEKQEEKPEEKKPEKSTEKDAEAVQEEAKDVPAEEFEIKDNSTSAASEEVSVVQAASEGPKNQTAPEQPATDTKAILITGQTHARELLSGQVPLFLCLKLIHQGVLQDKEKYQQMLAANKFYFLPTLNVDGSAVVEENWIKNGKIINKRKNMNPALFMKCGEENSGTDINRNFMVDW